MTTIRPIKVAGVVVSAGKMMKTVKVRLVKQEWHRHLRKRFTSFNHLLVNDPTSAVLAGDIITMTPERHSKRVMHTVSAILVPWGKPLDERPPLLSEEKRVEIREIKRAEKTERKAGNRRARGMSDERGRARSRENEVDGVLREGRDNVEEVVKEGLQRSGAGDEEPRTVGKEAQHRATDAEATAR